MNQAHEVHPLIALVEAVEAVRTTIRKGWQGIFKPKQNGTHNGTNGAAHGIRDRKELLYDGTGDW
jgi:hypothetical protein